MDFIALEGVEKTQNAAIVESINADHRECHISPGWLLIYQTTETELILVRTGPHSVLFD